VVRLQGAVQVAPGGSQGFASFSRAGRMASHMGSSMANGAAEYQTMKRSSDSSRVQQTIGGVGDSDT
jgi:type IV secretion system protein TrbL